MELQMILRVKPLAADLASESALMLASMREVLQMLRHCSKIIECTLIATLDHSHAVLFKYRLDL